MRATRDDTLTSPFVVALQDLRTIDNLCKEHFPSREFRAECSDSLVRYFSSLDDLSAYENPPRARITKLTISSHSPDYRSFLTLSVGTLGDYGNIHLSLDAEGQTATTTSAVVEDWLQGVRPWYAFLARSSIARLLERLTGLFFLIGALTFALGRSLAPNQPIHVDAILNVTARAVVLAAPVVAGLVIIEVLRVRVFPMGTFRIGQGDKRHKDLELWRTVVVLGFVVSLAAGILVAAL